MCGKRQYAASKSFALTNAVRAASRGGEWLQLAAPRHRPMLMLMSKYRLAGLRLLRGKLRSRLQGTPTYVLLRPMPHHVEILAADGGLMEVREDAPRRADVVQCRQWKRPLRITILRPSG
jgi:hypothetical protein